MTLETFSDIILRLQVQGGTLSTLYNQKVDLLDFVDPYEYVIMVLLKEIYGDEGYEWFSWFCHENNYGKDNLGAWDEDGNPICYSIDSLWEYLEKLKKEKI